MFKQKYDNRGRQNFVTRIEIQGPQKMQKLNEYPTAKSVDYEFIKD